MNMLINWGIKRFENWTSWRAVLESTRSKALNDPNPIQNTCDEVWWRNWSLKPCRSSSPIHFHSWVLAWIRLEFWPKSMIQSLILHLLHSMIQNIKEKCKVMWRNCKFWLRENFCYEMKTRSKNGKKWLSLQILLWLSIYTLS